MLGRLLLCVALAGAVSACVTASNTLSPDQVGSLKLTGVKVGFAPDARIHWNEGEYAYAATKGVLAQESDSVARTPEGQAYVRNILANKTKEAFQRNLGNVLKGSRPAIVDVQVKTLFVASAAQRIIVGGNHVMLADVNLVDPKTGAVIIAFPAQTAVAAAGQGIAGVLVDQALLGEPIDRVIDDYARQYSSWLLKPGGAS